MERGQFTFYRSFWEAVKTLSKKDRLAVLEAIIRFALDGEETGELTLRQEGLFVLIKPVLDTGRSRAKVGKLGGSKTKANAKQKLREKEIEKEVEKEVEKETENDRGKAGERVCRDSFFEDFWEKYPWKVGRQEALEAWHTLNPDEKTANQILKSLQEWKKTPRWQNEGGRYIPGAAKYLLQEYWKHIPQPPAVKEDIPQGATGQLGQAELENIQRLLKEG